MATSGRRLDDHVRNGIIQCLRDGRSLNETAARFGVSRQTVKNFKRSSKVIGILKPRTPTPEQMS